MTGIVLWGAQGRMGTAISALISAADDMTLVAAHDHGDAVPSAARAEVLIDFSTPSGFRGALAWALEADCAFVSGTTGLDAETAALLDAASVQIPVLVAANMSVGVAVVRALVRAAAGALPASFQPEIVELHHRAKVDAPSGTALALADDVDSARLTTRVFGREGSVGARAPSELGLHAVRGGDVVGEHTVYFFGEGERVEIVHRATDRAIFARGAITAARWIAGKPPGRYTIDDVLGL